MALDLSILTIIKASMVNEIIDFIETHILQIQAGKEKAIVAFLSSEGIDCPSYSDNQLYFSIMLSSIVADIDCQDTEYIRELNLDKIKEICNRKKLNYDFVVVCSSKIIQVSKILNNDN